MHFSTELEHLQVPSVFLLAWEAVQMKLIYFIEPTLYGYYTTYLWTVSDIQFLRKQVCVKFEHSLCMISP